MSVELPTREEIPEKYRWDLQNIFTDDEAWDTAVISIQANLPEIAEYQGRLGDSADTLHSFLQMQDRLTKEGHNAYMYAMLQASVDMQDQTAAARVDRVRGMSAQLQGAFSFAVPEIMALGAEKISTLVAESDDLTPYTHYFERLFEQKKHVRSSEVEQLLAMAGGVFSTMTATHSILANADIPFAPAVDKAGQEHPVAQGSIRGLVASPDRQLRKNGYESYADAHLDYKNTMANALSAGIKRNVFMSRARGYASALEASLKQDFIPTAVFHNLINTFQKNLPTWHKYWRVRRQALGYSKLYEYDIKAPLSPNPPKVSYEQAVDWIAEGMRPLGDEYVNTLKRGSLQERWVDVMPNKGKRMGAFSAGGPGTNPFIMMSFTPDLLGMSTLAHELGHSLHSYNTWETQKQTVYANYGLFVAEVASNFNQALVRSHLFDTQPDVGFQISLLEEAMANFHRYFFIMPTLARFELAIHERVEQGKALNADFLIKHMAELFGEGYSSELEMDEERIGITWAEFHTHLYSNFYVYKYATGISAAHALLDPIKQGDETAVANYLSFLKAGGSMYPMDVLKLAGVDMTTPEPVEQAFATLASHVDRLEKLVSQQSRPSYSTRTAA